MDEFNKLNRKLDRIERSLNHGEGSIWIEDVREQDGKVTIPVWIKGFSHKKINDFDFQLRFIAADLEFISVSRGTGTCRWQQLGGNIKGPSPEILTVGGYAGGAGFLEDCGCWELCKITFQSLRIGATFITLEDYDGDIHLLNPREYQKTFDIGK